MTDLYDYHNGPNLGLEPTTPRQTRGDYMTDIKLPPLPEKVVISTHLPTGVRIYGYTADQMQAYASEAVRLNAWEPRAIIHAADCWSWGLEHHECAVCEIWRLRGERTMLRAALGRLISYATQLEQMAYSPDYVREHPDMRNAREALAHGGEG